VQAMDDQKVSENHLLMGSGPHYFLRWTLEVQMQSIEAARQKGFPE